MRKKVIALLLCCAMTAGVLAGCGNSDTVNDEVESKSTQAEESTAEASAESESVPEETEEEQELLKVVWNGLGGGTDYSGFTDFIEEKFNVDLELVEKPNAEAFALLATSGGLYDYNHQSSFNFVKYYEFVDQGSFRALPDGWEEKWPNLYRMLDKSGTLDLLTVDGEVYAIPHATFGQQVDIDPITQHGMLCWRKDWAEEVGMADMGDDYTVTISELKAYLEAVKAAGLTEKSYIFSHPYYLRMAFGGALKVECNDFADRGNTYVWTPSTPEFTEMIATMQDWYADGLIYSEFYDCAHNEGPTLLAAGECAAIQTDGGDIYEFDSLFATEYPDKNMLDTIGCAVLTGDDEVVWAPQVSNYWSWSFLSPDSDEAVVERVLDIIDYACSEEGQLAWQLGIPEQDWTMKADGTIEMLNGSNGISDYTNVWNTVGVVGYCDDDFGFSPLNPTKKPELTQIILDLYDLKAQGNPYPVTWAYSNNRGDLKTAYTGSVKVEDFLAQAVISTEDPEKLVSEYVEANRTLWEPLLAEVNEIAGY